MQVEKASHSPGRRFAGHLPERAEYRMAAIDVGSNSLHMIIAQTDPDGAITTLWRMKEMVGLGRISFPARRLSGEAMDRAIATLRRFISDRGKIRSRRITGACRRHQSQVARAVKRARELALLPYGAEGSGDHRGGRGDRDRGDRDRDR